MVISAESASNGQAFGYFSACASGLLVFGIVYALTLLLFRRVLHVDLARGIWPPLTTAVGVFVTVCVYGLWVHLAWPLTDPDVLTEVLFWFFVASGSPAIIVRIVELAAAEHGAHMARVITSERMQAVAGVTRTLAAAGEVEAAGHDEA